MVAIVESAFRDHWGRVLAALIGFLGDFDLAEEATQEAFAIAADPVDRAVARGGHEPRSRVRRHPLAGPALRSGRERLLGGFLGEVEVAEEADQGGEDAAPLLAEDLLEDPQLSLSGRISIAPPSRAAGIRDASSIAASRFSAS